MNENNILKRAIMRDPRFGYLPAEDRHYTADKGDKLRFAVIGSGIMGQEHIRITEIEGRAKVTAVYDSNPASVEAAVGNARLFDPERKLRIYKSIEEAVSDSEVDAFLICTPNYTHLEVLRKFEGCGKPILLEKPMATTLGDAAAIMEIADNYDSVFQLGLQYRYKAIYMEAARDVLGDEAVGDVKTMNIAERRIPFLDKVGQWNKQAKFSGGTLVEKCCHYFDLFNYFARSKPVRVSASGSQAVNFRDFSYRGERSDILDNAFVIVEYANGIRACFSLCMFSPLFFEELVICGDRGMVRTWEKEDFLDNEGLSTTYELFRGEDGLSRKSTPAYPKLIQNSGHSGATYFEHMYFVDNMLGQKTGTATAAEGFWSVAVGAAAEESVKTGRPVMIDEMLGKAGLGGIRHFTEA